MAGQPGQRRMTTSLSVDIRPWTEGDLATLLAMNNASVPAVSGLNASELQRLLEQSSPTLVAVVNSQAVGFVECLGPGLEYTSENYRWFSARYPSFAYVDRVVVAEHHRGQRVGQALYEALDHRAPADVPVILCEVNLDPPNPGSLRFHARLGFEEVGREVHGGKLVSLLARRRG